MNHRRVLLTLLVLSSLSAAAEAPDHQQEDRIPLSAVITSIPKTSWETLKYSFTKDSLPAWATIIGTTAIFYHYDEDLYGGARATGRRWGLGNNDNTRTFVQGFGYDLLRLPTDGGSSLYFLGDGWMHVGIAAGFFAEGSLTDNHRAYNTGLQMVHGMIVSTIFSQMVKRATGRESPYVANEPRGRWRPFPSLAEYQRNTSSYDAFPSGHIMTATLIFTVINDNYPEWRSWVMPLEVVWLGLLGFEMINNGVHWASDYPLGIGIGYAVGKMTAGLRAGSSTGKTANWIYFPSLTAEGPLVTVVHRF